MTLEEIKKVFSGKEKIICLTRGFSVKVIPDAFEQCNHVLSQGNWYVRMPDGFRAKIYCARTRTVASIHE